MGKIGGFTDPTAGGQASPTPVWYRILKQDKNSIVTTLEELSNNTEPYQDILDRLTAYAAADSVSSFFLVENDPTTGQWFDVQVIAGTGQTVPTGPVDVKETEFKRLWKAYEPLWILMIAGFSSAVLGIILITWYKHGAPLPQGAS